MKFAECMRANGVSAFPDPDASGALTIDAVANGSSLDTNSAAFEQALSACKDLEPPGFTGNKGTPEQRRRALAFAQCIRDNGVRDFPDPSKTSPLVDTNRIPSAATPGGMTHSQRRDAEVRPVRGRGRRTGEPVMRKRWVLAAQRSSSLPQPPSASWSSTSGGGQATPAAQASPVNTATVDAGTLSDMVSQYGILTYRARSDGSPYAVINRAGGTYTELPECGRQGRAAATCSIG